MSCVCYTRKGMYEHVVLPLVMSVLSSFSAARGQALMQRGYFSFIVSLRMFLVL